MTSQPIKKLLKEKSGIKLDIGCGANKHPGFVGIDYRPLKGVDIVHNLEQFPYPLKDESVLVAISSHVLEHINPHFGDVRVYPLIQLLLKKGVITTSEVRKNLGNFEDQPRFFGLMNEVWRILQPDGEFAVVVPYATSHGMHQDPTHINFINETTWAYFDPLEPRYDGWLYKIYKPKPWAIKSSAFSGNGNLEVVLIKRKEDRSYYA